VASSGDVTIGPTQAFLVLSLEALNA